MATLLTRKMNVLINRNFALLWSGSIISRFGDAIFETALILWIAATIAHGQPWAPLAVSRCLIAEFIPIFLVAPVAGVFVDQRKEKRRIMLLMDLARAILVGLLILVTGIFSFWGKSLSLFWQLGFIYIDIFLISICTQFFIQASNVIYYDIVDATNRARGAGLMQTITSAASIVGPPLATLLFFAIGAQWALLLNALSFLGSFSFILALHIPQHDSEVREPEQHRSFLSQLLEGIRFLLGNTLLRTILITGILFYLWNSSFTTLGIFFLSDNLHTPLAFYGWLGTSLGIGLAVGAFLASLFTHKLGEVRVYYCSTLAMGGLMIVLARLTNFLPTLVVVFFLGLLSAAINVALLPLVLHVTPRNLIGRVASVLGSTVTLTRIFFAALIGWLDSSVLLHFHPLLFSIQFGPHDTLFSVAGLLIIVGGLYALTNLRGIRIVNNEQSQITEPEKSDKEPSSL